MKIDYKVSDKASKFLVPNGNGNIDVVADMNWTLTPKNARRNVPAAYLTEYQQTQGQLVSSILFYARTINNLNSIGDLIKSPADPNDIYKFKYLAEKTGFTYKIPYFAPKKVSRATQFGYEDGESPFAPLMNLGTKISPTGIKGNSIYGSVVGGMAIASAIGGVVNTLLPGKLSLENPQSWTGTEEGIYTLTFDLFNTGTIEELQNNRNLAYILSYQNSPSRRNAAIVDPTVIYEVYIPDVVHMLAAVMENLEITNLGNTRMILNDEGVKQIIPEAYRITMSFRHLFMPTRNIMRGMDEGSRLSAIGNSENIEQFISALQSGDSKAIDLIPKVMKDTGASRDFLEDIVKTQANF